MTGENRMTIENKIIVPITTIEMHFDFNVSQQIVGRYEEEGL